VGGWTTRRSRYSWLSLALGFLAAFLALPSFTDPWPGNAGGFAFVVLVVAAVVRGAIALGEAFRDGWREPPRPAARWSDAPRP
jgi:hypothetical protein